MTGARRQKVVVRGALLAFAAVAAAGVYVIAVVPPSQGWFYPRCRLHALTGLHCPGCGTTRALHAALNGQFGQALAYNALAPVLVPTLAGLIVWSFLGAGRQPAPARSGRWSRVWPWLLIAVLLLFGVLRNIPVEPFTRLAPHQL